MVRTIVWTDTAKASLKAIFDYYSENVNLTVARIIKNQIIADISFLKTDNYLGAKEPLLTDFEKDYRYLVSTNYKIIYFTDNNIIVISLIFDTRRNPQTLIDLLKK